MFKQRAYLCLPGDMSTFLPLPQTTAYHLDPYKWVSLMQLNASNLLHCIGKSIAH